MAEKSIIAKLAPNVFLPKRIHGQPESVGVLILGTLVGLANDFKTGKAANGDEFRGFAGSFEFVDAQDVTRPVQQSGVLYLPSGVDDMVASALDAVIESGGQVQLAMEVSVTRAKNAAGYSWQFRNLVDNVAIDPLEELRQLAVSRASDQKTIAAPVKSEAELEIERKAAEHEQNVAAEAEAGKVKEKAGK